jgi:hypothetical protein
MYAQQILADPKYSKYKCTRGVVIHATTKSSTRDSGREGENLTSVFGVWLDLH